MNTSDIRDNKTHGSVGDFLKEVITDGSKLSVVSAYFTIYAYYALHKNLYAISGMRFLFGEPTFIKNIDSEKNNVRSYKIQDDGISLSSTEKLSQKKIARECAEWLSEKAEIRSMVKPNFLHGKMYYVEQANGVEKAISGSSNFTVNGLGLGKDSNIELNLIVDSDRQRKDLKNWFDTIWNDETGLVEDVKEEVLKYLNLLYAENSPELVYFKTLYHIFESYLSEQQDHNLLDEKTKFFETEIWKALYEFQKDGVKGAINKIQKHGGCIIADSVGLGKTFEALAVIKYFELKNYRVLVLCPKKLSSNWTLYQANQNNTLNPFTKDRFGYTVLYHTDVNRTSGKSDANSITLEAFNWSAYDLVVIDESHNFKGNPMQKQTESGDVVLNRAACLMENIIKSGSKTRVLMLSATPVNNSLKDLRNQISFITEGDAHALYDSTSIKDIDMILKTAQRQFTNWADPKKNSKRRASELMQRLDSSFFKLLDELTIARSRKHITKFYDTNAIGKFSERQKPVSIFSEIDLNDDFPSYTKIDKDISGYKLSLFNPTAYVKDEKKSLYVNAAQAQKNFVQSDREHFLIGMMKVGFLKRLESSIFSFRLSLERTIDKIKNLETKIKTFNEYKETHEQTELNFDDEFEDEQEESEFEVGKSLKFKLEDLDTQKWLADLKADRDNLRDLYLQAKDVTPERDAKLAMLKEHITEKINSPLNDGNKKVLVFTAFSDTAKYIYDNIASWAKKEFGIDSALVSGNKNETTFGEARFESILTNFSPISKNRSGHSNMPQDGQIDILIATNCISEGQNLQDCDYLINYDIHWNPVRLIQRFGRIDRLGSKNTKIQMVNFWPTPDLDDYINLKTRVESRMALVDLAATNEDNVLETDGEEMKDLITEDMKYRDAQLKRLQNEVLDLEDIDESISLTDFTLDDFRVELSNYLKENEDMLKSSPDGIYAVVPSPATWESIEASEKYTEKKYDKTAYDIIRGGVIYCLKQKNENEECEKINPLNPYFLVYVYDDGGVRYNYTSAKQILEIYRLLCSGERLPYKELCDLFNKETKDGSDMASYSNLLEKAASEIMSSFKKRASMKLTTSRNALLIAKDKQAADITDFVLVTWLVIK